MEEKMLKERQKNEWKKKTKGDKVFYGLFNKFNDWQSKPNQ